eukprot:Seg4013.1 transcript_id=Seg4013.1/GoldUCD/mRNA.D3Y31 product="hypothetical protein" protein_id=Seg4013.1/GoldUCD/D3Y31
MVNGNCAVVGCTNSRYKIKVWEKKDCHEHSGQVHKDCPCPPPFYLHSFPSKLLNSEKRKEWIRLVKRTRKGNKEWTPGQSDMVCSKYFVDMRPTLENPNPFLDLGYEKPAKKARRVLVRPDNSVATKSVADDSVSDKLDSLETVSCGTPEEHSCAKVSQEQCQSCSSNKSVMGSLLMIVGALSKEKTVLKVTIDELSKELETLKIAKKKERRPMSTSLIKTDSKMKFYSGIQTVAIFMALFALLKPFVPKLVFWRGTKTIVSYDIVRTCAAICNIQPPLIKPTMKEK